MDNDTNTKKKELSEIYMLPCSLHDYLLARKFSSEDVVMVIGLTGDLCSNPSNAERSLQYKAAKLGISVVLDLKYHNIGSKIYAYGTGYKLRNIETINYDYL